MIEWNYIKDKQPEEDRLVLVTYKSKINQRRKANQKILLFKAKWNYQTKNFEFIEKLPNNLYLELNFEYWCYYSEFNKMKIRVHEFLKQRDGQDCQICKHHKQENFSIDHKLPVSRGGKNYLSNLQLAHVSCNTKKGNS